MMYTLLLLSCQHNALELSLLTQLSRGKSRAETFLFSKNAVICQHGGRMSLMLRLGDIRRRSQIVGASVHMLLLQRRQTDYDEDLPCHQRCLRVNTEYDDNFFFLAWPFKVSRPGTIKLNPLASCNAALLQRNMFSPSY